MLTACDADDALRAATAHTGAIDLVLTDLLMPGGGGRQVIERLRDGGHLTRVLLMSGYTDDEVLRRGLRHADFPFVQKPFSLDELARRVREVLDAAPASSRA